MQMVYAREDNMDLWTIYCPKKGWAWFKFLFHGFGRPYSIWTNMRFNVYNVLGHLFTSSMDLLESCLAKFSYFLWSNIYVGRCSLYQIKEHTKNELIALVKGKCILFIHKLHIEKKTYLWINNLLEKVHFVSITWRKMVNLYLFIYTLINNSDCV